jgi:hypothetical protein
VLQRAATRIQPADPRLAWRLDGPAALAGLMDDRTAPAAFRAVDRLQASLDKSADPPACVLVVIAHAAMRRACSPDEAEELMERALAREPYPPRPNASAAIIVTLLGLEAFGTLQQLCDDMLKAAQQRSAAQELIGVASFSAWALYRRGELADAEAQARWALEHATGIWAIDALAHLVETLVERDALDDAADELGRMTPPLASHTVVVAGYLIARGRLRLAQGKPRRRCRISWPAASDAGGSGSPTAYTAGAPRQQLRMPCSGRRLRPGGSPGRRSRWRAASGGPGASSWGHSCAPCRITASPGLKWCRRWSSAW